MPEVRHPCGRPSTTRAPRATAGTMRTSSSVGPRRHRRRPAGEAPPALALLGLLLAGVRSVHAQCAERPECLDDGIPNK